MTSPAPDPAAELPLAGQPSAERADAARNRVRLLDAATRLVEERGAEHVTMEAVASAAGVGKGTVYRRFGDRAGLMFALLDHAERAFQQDFLSGPPPLGPGAPPRERLAAFGAATIRHEIRYLDLYLEAEPKPARRYSPHPPREVRALHLASLLRAGGATGDIDVIAEVLTSYLGTPFLNRLYRHRGMPPERIEAGWLDLIDRLLATTSAGAVDRSSGSSLPLGTRRTSRPGGRVGGREPAAEERPDSTGQGGC